MSPFCDEICQDTCLRNGGGRDCVEACGCDYQVKLAGPFCDEVCQDTCLEVVVKRLCEACDCDYQVKLAGPFCDEVCQDTCLRNGGGRDYVMKLVVII